MITKEEETTPLYICNECSKEIDNCKPCFTTDPARFKCGFAAFEFDKDYKITKTKTGSERLEELAEEERTASIIKAFRELAEMMKTVTVSQPVEVSPESMSGGITFTTEGTGETPNCMDCKWKGSNSRIRNDVIINYHTCNAQGARSIKIAYNTPECKSLYQTRQEKCSCHI